MTTFDGTGSPRQHFDFSSEPTEAPQAEAPGFPAQEQPQSALDMLRGAMAQRDAESDEPTLENGGLTAVEVPGMPVRLVCRTSITYSEQLGWQKASFPKRARGGRSAQPNPWEFDAVMNAMIVLTDTNIRVEAKAASGAWSPITGADGHPLTVSDSELLGQFGTVDPKSFLRKLFGGTRGEAGLVESGRKVLTAAGWGTAGDDSEDPTD